MCNFVLAVHFRETYERINLLFWYTVAAGVSTASFSKLYTVDSRNSSIGRPDPNKFRPDKGGWSGPIHSGHKGRFAFKSFDACKLREHSQLTATCSIIASACCHMFRVLCERGLVSSLVRSNAKTALLWKKKEKNVGVKMGSFASASVQWFELWLLRVLLRRLNFMGCAPATACVL